MPTHLPPDPNQTRAVCIADAGPDFWRGVGGYNSGTYSTRKEAVNKHYRMQVWDHLVNIRQGR